MIENLSAIMLRGRNVPPDLREKFYNWMFEAYIPILLTIPGLEAVEHYHIFKENPLYPGLLGIYHYQNTSLRGQKIRIGMRYLGIRLQLLPE